MRDPSHAMQAAYVPALKASTGVKALLGDPARVRDLVEAVPVYPYARIGDDEVLPQANGCFDQWEMFVTIHVFSRASAPRPEAKLILDAIAGVMADDDAPLTLDGFTTSLSEYHSSRTFMEADGVTAHGVGVFRYLLDAA